MTLDILGLGQTASLAMVFAAGYVIVNLIHEPTHYLAARAAGCPAQFTIGSQFSCEYYLAERWEPGGLVDRAILLAPTLVGLVVGIAWLSVYGWPPATELSAIGILLWAWYSLPSPEDLGLEEWDLRDGDARASAAVGALLLVLAAVIGMAPGTFAPESYTGFGTLVAGALALAAGVQLMWAIIHADESMLPDDIDEPAAGDDPDAEPGVSD